MALFAEVGPSRGPRLGEKEHGRMRRESKERCCVTPERNRGGQQDKSEAAGGDGEGSEKERADRVAVAGKGSV